MSTEPTRILVGETAEIEAAIGGEQPELEDVIERFVALLMASCRVMPRLVDTILNENPPCITRAQLLLFMAACNNLNQILDRLLARLERVS